MTAAAEPLTLLGEIDCLLDKLTTLDLTALPSDQLLEFTREWERLKHRGTVIDHAAVAELDGRQLAGEKSLPSTAALLAHLLRLDPSVARRRVEDAADFGPRRGLTSEALEPLHPHTAQALAEGSISIEHARAVADLFARIPAQTVEGEAAIETTALHAAAVCSPLRFRQWCVQAAARLDQDGIEPDDEIKQRQRGVSVHDRPDGTARLTGTLTADVAAALRAVLGPLSAPDPAEDGTRDQRTAAQRRHDALRDACDRLLRSGTLPESGGAPTTVLVTVDYHDLLRHWQQQTGGEPNGGCGGGQTGYGVTSYGTLIPVAELLRRAGDADIIPVILTDTGGILGYGRSRRLASAAQRRALTARDGGCIRPGCTVPADWCQSHHVRPWQAGGTTDIDNMALLCPHHHRDLDHHATITMINGVPHWVEPPWIDPRQVPRRNTAHHIPRILQPPPGVGRLRC